MVLLPVVVWLSLEFASAMGLFRGANWSRTLTVVVLAAGLVIGVVALLVEPIVATIQIVVSGIFLYYLTRPNVKAYFA